MCSQYLVEDCRVVDGKEVPVSTPSVNYFHLPGPLEFSKANRTEAPHSTSMGRSGACFQGLELSENEK